MIPWPLGKALMARERDPVAARTRRMILPITAGSLLSEVAQKRCVRTARPPLWAHRLARFGGDRGRAEFITSKNDPLTTPASPHAVRHETDQREVDSREVARRDGVTRT
jgi:hypothetical protein